MSGKQQRTVGDYVTLQRGTTYKGVLVGKPGPALLGLGSIELGGGFRNDYQTYGGDCPANLMCSPGDLYVALKGATKDGKMIGSVARVPSTVPSGRLTQDTVKLVFQNPDRDTINFLYWVLRTPQYRSYCSGHAMGSAVVALSRVDFLNYPVPCQTPRRQKLVAVLDDVEEKIELNHRMCESLDATARALFNAWFVDFEPVLAKMNGIWKRGQSLPGLPAHLFDLFPDVLESWKMGDKPKGWKTGTLEEVAEHFKEQQNPLSSPDTIFTHYSLPAFDEGQQARFEYGREIKSNKWRVPAESVLLSKLNPEIERVWFVDEKLTENAVCSTEFLVFRAKPPFTRTYLYCLARSPIFRQQIQSLVTGTSKSHQRAQLPSILALDVLLPPEPIVKQFDIVVAKLLHRAVLCRRSSSSLAALRDILLPRLSSNELSADIVEPLVAGSV